MVKLNRLFKLSRSLGAAASLTLASSALALNYDVNYSPNPPAIDGLATDSVWANASSAVTGFVVYNNVTEISTEQTQVRALWNSTHLYLLYEATDSEIKAAATANDTGFVFSGAVDTAEIFIDPSWSQATTQNDKVYHIVVDPAATAYTYTEAGNGELGWDLSSASQIAYAPNGTNWTVEAAIAWSDFNSTGTKSPGILKRPPIDGAIWGAQFGRIHSTDTTPNNTGFSKWNPTSGAFRARPLGTLTFKGGPASSKVDISTGTVTYATSFEAPTYTAGSTVLGTESWSAINSDVWTASDVEKLSGNQALRISAATAGQVLNQVQHTTNTQTPQYMQYALRLPSEQIIAGSYRHVLYLQGAYSAGNAIDAMGQLWFRNSNTDGSNSVAVVSFENPLNETQTTTTNFAGLLPYDKWMWVTVKTDPIEKKFEVWLNDTKLTLPDGQDKFGIRRKSSFLQLAYGQLYNKNYGTEPLYVDDVTYVEEPQASRVSDWQLF